MTPIPGSLVDRVRLPSCTMRGPARVVRRPPIEGGPPDRCASASSRPSALAHADRHVAARCVHVAQLHYNVRMKTATIPAVRVEPEFRAEMEAVLADGESMSEFVEASVRAGVERRRVQAEFVARGLRSRDEARRTGDYVDADVVVDGLQRKLDAARARAVKTRK
jgi:chitinase